MNTKKTKTFSFYSAYSSSFSVYFITALDSKKEKKKKNMNNKQNKHNKQLREKKEIKIRQTANKHPRKKWMICWYNMHKTNDILMEKCGVSTWQKSFCFLFSINILHIFYHIIYSKEKKQNKNMNHLRMWCLHLALYCHTVSYHS